MADPIVPPRRGEFLTPKGVATPRFNEYLERLTALTNTVSDNTESLSGFNPGAAAQGQQQKQINGLQLVNSINQANAAIAALNKKIRDLELLIGMQPNLSGFKKNFKVTPVTADYTTTGNEIIICANTTAITITLNATGKNKDEIVIVRQNTGSVAVSGAVNGGTGFNILARYDAPHMVYTVDAGEYNII